ncbi:hypothetical protein [Prescottella agglutinans]|uniref:Uncharacterized protein n=1 Tax=Prescottella agglutinans TaxID=1644129 RepID=A0ABT6MGW2_9NOCA|nr:hypothetical protein [Prescottella agglutinans]MDH6283115.1 hypothetical protein [Prescottella agglutinans]
MSALTEDTMQLEPVILTAREATAARRQAEDLLHRKLPVSDYERNLYVEEGLEPPTE